MKQVLLLSITFTLLIPFPTLSQERSETSPVALNEARGRCEAAWRDGEPGAAMACLTEDFALLLPGGRSERRTKEADWRNLRIPIGSRFLPQRFFEHGTRILETGRAWIPVPPVAEPDVDEPLCAPYEYGQQQVSYLREWIRDQGGSWRLRSIVLQ
jgi:hypothetical protein